jgi:predicted ester cyclase
MRQLPMLAVFVAACVPRSTTLRQSETPQAHSAFQLLFEQALTHRDTVALGKAVAPELIFHARGATVRVSRMELWQLSAPILQAFPDIQFRVESVVTAGDSAAARVSFSGTHRGIWNGIAPTQRRVTVTEMFFCRLRARQLAECWQEWDEYGLRQQLAAPAQ